MKPIYIYGDSHGEWTEILLKISRFDIKNCYLIHVGDIGIGFLDKENEIDKLNYLNRIFKDKDISFLGIAGNHDNPEYFKGNSDLLGINFSHIELLPSYTQREINGQNFLFIGGAVSIDRANRTEGLDYWKHEEIIPPPEGLFRLDSIQSNLIQPDLIPDVIVSHDCPLEVGFSTHKLYDAPGNPVKTDAIRGRQILSDIWAEYPPKQWFYGHYHASRTDYVHKSGKITKFTMLNIHEMVEIL